MSDLTFVEKRHLEALFGMAPGVVLNFSDRTFAEFVYDSVGKDITEQRYYAGGPSKAKRLRTFWAIEPNPIVGKVILDLCMYCKEFCWDEQKAHAFERSLETVRRLTGKSASTPKDKAGAVPNAVTQEPDPAKQSNALQVLLGKFEEMAHSTDVHRRGYLLQDVLNDLFKLHNIPTTPSFARNEGGEQIDGAFKFDGWHYLAECKWAQKLSNTAELDALGGKVGRSGKQTMGLFLSIEGWSAHVPNLLKQNPNKSVVLMDGYDLRCVLADEIKLEDLLHGKLTHFNVHAEPFCSASQIIKRS